MLTGPRRTVEHARRLRRDMSLPEGLLWRGLRQRPGGFKFRRQHPAGAYVLDFFCAEVRLAIEIDGIAHDMGDRPARDAARDDWLASHGVEVVRVPASEVLGDIGHVIEAIVAACMSRSPLHRPADGPPPRAGEEL